MYQLLPPLTLAKTLGRPDAPLVLDLRTHEDFAADPRIVPSALHLDHRTITRDSLGHLAVGRAIVLLCHKGAKLSLGAAARLRAEGAQADVLEGGVLAWHAARLPVTLAAALPETGLWAMAPGPGAAFAQWLLARFAPPGQTLLVVAADQRDAVADRFAAAPVGSGLALLAQLGLDTVALATLAQTCIAAPETPLAFASLIANCARDARAAGPDAPALAVLDAAWAALRPETGL